MKTEIGYKLFRMKKDGKLYPLYVLADKPTPMGVWVKAECGELQENGKVKAKLGDGLCYRPGWHLADVPTCTHIGKKAEDGSLVQRKGTVWCEVEYITDVDYQLEANANGTNDKGVIVPVKAYIKHLPVGGFYRYKTNPNMMGDWIISGEMKVNKILTDVDIIDICDKYGVAPQKKEA